MKKTIGFIVSISLMGCFTLSAQQLPLISQYVQNDFVLNPAIAGNKDYAPIRTSIRNQWAGLEGNPNSQTLSFHSAMKNPKVGIGAFLFNDKIGPISQTGISASYAYHLKLSNESKLSFGLSGLLSIHQLNTNQLKFDQQNNTDNVLTTGDFKAYYPNFSFGTYYTGKNYYVGLSIPELIQTKISNSKDYFIIQQARHYYLTGGYKFKLNENYTVLPSFLIRYVSAAPIGIDINASFEAFEKFNFGISYRKADAIVPFFGFRIKETYILCYSYDITMSGLNKHTRGSHEITLGYNLHRKKSNASIQ
ncbi:MAG: type IX secretion system membrane protein PorP/SprF [Bacteroidetes bacterium]|nr:type IX secretion system membrane protein PorP/SprF [Bacteroidota bacterium]HET6245612.1 type IX secretion system membrane protein PorP/SprF [Bacteroidia bacterium]